MRSNKAGFLVVTFIGLIFVSPASADICRSWSAPTKVGTLDEKMLGEASGMAASRTFSGRLYHHNDSGDGPYFYFTDSTGAGTEKVEFASKNPKDMEDMALGPCVEGSCLFFGDIGDNNRNRKTIGLWIVPEQASYPGGQALGKQVILGYPDGPHDAESLAVHPLTGDVYVLTKEYSLEDRKSSAAQLYRAPAASIGGYVSGSVLPLEKVGAIDLPWLAYEFGFWGQVATSMEFRPDGGTLVVLTYENLIEIQASSALAGQTRDWSEGVDYSVVPLRGLLPQMEAVTYSADGLSIYIESESLDQESETRAQREVQKKGAPIYQLRCQN